MLIIAHNVDGVTLYRGLQYNAERHHHCCSTQGYSYQQHIRAPFGLQYGDVGPKVTQFLASHYL